MNLRLNRVSDTKLILKKLSLILHLLNHELIHSLMFLMYVIIH